MLDVLADVRLAGLVKVAELCLRQPDGLILKTHVDFRQAVLGLIQLHNILIISPAVLISRHGYKQTILSFYDTDILHHKRILNIHSRKTSDMRTFFFIHIHRYIKLRLSHTIPHFQTVFSEILTIFICIEDCTCKLLLKLLCDRISHALIDMLPILIYLVAAI